MPLHSNTVLRTAGEIRVTGALLQHAELRMHPSKHDTGVMLLLVDTGTGLPYEVRMRVGDSPSALIAAKSKEAQLRAGDRVLVIGHGLRLSHDHSVERLVMLEVDSVMPLHTPAAMRDALHEPNDQAELALQERAA